MKTTITILILLLSTIGHASSLYIKCERRTVEWYGNTEVTTIYNILLENKKLSLSLINGRDFRALSFRATDSGYISELVGGNFLILDRASKTATVKLKLYCQSEKSCQYEDLKYKCVWRD